MCSAVKVYIRKGYPRNKTTYLAVKSYSISTHSYLSQQPICFTVIFLDTYAHRLPSPSMSLPSNILVATWDMQDGDSAAKQEMMLGSSEESVQGQDTRILVTPNEFKTGGKYRGT